MKQLKDPVYGYIEVNSRHIPIINSAEFQRLRNIRQTGYASLYPSALHNRFVYSHGVFHLGKKAVNYLRANIGAQMGDHFDDVYGWEAIKETFILGCLLHDVGHSPFSHTGERFYNASTIFEEEFRNLIQSPDFDHDVAEQGTGKSHEAMSAIIGINLLQKMEEHYFSRDIRFKPLWKSEAEYNLKVKEGIAPRKLENMLDVLRGSVKDFRLFFIL